MKLKRLKGTTSTWLLAKSFKITMVKITLMGLAYEARHTIMRVKVVLRAESRSQSA